MASSITLAISILAIQRGGKVWRRMSRNSAHQVCKSTGLGHTLLLLKHSQMVATCCTRGITSTLALGQEEEKMDFSEQCSVSATTTLFPYFSSLVFLPAVKDPKFFRIQKIINSYVSGPVLNLRDSYSSKCSLTS